MRNSTQPQHARAPSHASSLRGFISEAALGFQPNGTGQAYKQFLFCFSRGGTEPFNGLALHRRARSRVRRSRLRRYPESPPSSHTQGPPACRACAKKRRAEDTRSTARLESCRRIVALTSLRSSTDSSRRERTSRRRRSRGWHRRFRRVCSRRRPRTCRPL